jgi:hypothetical protein
MSVRASRVLTIETERVDENGYTVIVKKGTVVAGARWKARSWISSPRPRVRCRRSVGLVREQGTPDD